MNRNLARANLLSAVRMVVLATKTVEYFTRVLKQMVRDLYRGDITEGDFVDHLADLVQEQLTRAFHEGMRVNGYEPEDMEPEWQTVLDNIILNEYNYIDQFAADIVAGRNPDVPEQEGWAPFLARADMWANRYNDVVNQAIMLTSEEKLLWVMGATEDHCDTCAQLNGIVARASIWNELGVHPQQPENNKLECGGWRCQCQLVPTSNRQTRDARGEIQRAVR